MKIDNFISSCFPNKNNLVLPQNKDLPELKKTWGKVIDDFTKDFGPKTKEAKNIIDKAKKREEEIENERIKVQRIKIDAENKLKTAEEEDKKNLQKILNKYQGENLEKELDRLTELPIESLSLVEKDEKYVEDQTPSPHNISATMSAITYSANGFIGYDSGMDNRTAEPRESSEESAEESQPVKKHVPLPWLVIFTKPLKTLPPTDEELKNFKLLKRKQIKSWADRDIGRFVILIDLENLSRSHLAVYNLDKQTDDIYDHACINEGSVCFGNRADSYDSLGKKYQIFDMVDMIFDLLQSVATARPYSYPHCEWDKWFERSESIKTEDVYEKVKNFLKCQTRSRSTEPSLARAFEQEYTTQSWDPIGSNGIGGGGVGGSGGATISVGTTTTISDPSRSLGDQNRAMVETEVNNYLRNLEAQLQESRARYEMEATRARLMQQQIARTPSGESNDILDMLAGTQENNGL